MKIHLRVIQGIIPKEAGKIDQQMARGAIRVAIERVPFQP